MDFIFNEEQRAIEETARAVLEGMAIPDRVDQVEHTVDRFDADLWAALASADLLGLVVPEATGGAGYGMVELAVLLEAQGRVVAPVPLWSTLALGALPIAEFGSGHLREEVLPGVAAGEVVLTAALTDVAGDIAVGGSGKPTVEAKWEGGSVLLFGGASTVPQAHVADRILVPATIDDGIIVVALDPGAHGVVMERASTTNREIHPHVHLDGVRVAAADILAGGDPSRGNEILKWMLERAWTGLSALQVGVVEAAVSQTVDYLNSREQFGRPLSTFQGTSLRLADAAIDLEAIRVTLWQAAWRLDNGLDAALAVNVAAWFASDAGQRAVHATQHLHGGIGADISFPIHRYFLWGKQIELLLGASSAQLARLGGQVAAQVRAGRELMP